jgi:hypothetical protein
MNFYLNSFGGTTQVGPGLANSSARLSVGGNIIASGSVQGMGDFTGNAAGVSNQLYYNSAGYGGIQPYDNPNGLSKNLALQEFGGNVWIGSSPSFGTYKLQINGETFSADRLTIGRNRTLNNQGITGLTVSVPAATFTDNNTSTSGTISHVVGASIGRPTLAAVSTGVTYTNASTFYIDGDPAAGTNVTITNPYALYIASGRTRLGTVDSTSTAINMLYEDANGVIKKTAVPSSGISGSGTSGRLAYWNGSSSLTSDANGLYSNSNNGTLSIGTTNTQGHLNIGGDKTLSSSGTQSYFAAASYNDATTTTGGTSSSFAINYMAQPTITATNIGITFPNIYTLYLEKPAAGTHATIQKSYSLYCDGPIKLNQSVQRAYTGIAANTTLDDTYDIIGASASGGNITVTLPSASGNTGLTYIIKKTDATGNTCTVVGTIDGTTNYVLSTQYQYVQVASNGTDWYIIGKN